MVARLKKAFQKPNSAAFIFWLLELKATKDYNNGQGVVQQFKSIVPFFRQWVSMAFIFLTASLLLIALALQTNADASYLPIPIQLGYLASQASFLLFSYIYISYILSSSLVINTSKSVFSNLLCLSLSLRLFILPTVITYSSSSTAIQSQARLVGS